MLHTFRKKLEAP